MPSMRLWRVIMLLLLWLPAIAALSEERPADFTRDIQPILADNCYFCHGPDSNKRKADFRLDRLDPKLGPFAPRDGYSILRPGEPDESVLVMRISSDDPEVKMPPPHANRHLTDTQIKRI